MDAPVKRFGNWFKTSITVRMLVVGFILLVLLIPLGFVKELIPGTWIQATRGD